MRSIRRLSSGENARKTLVLKLDSNKTRRAHDINYSGLGSFYPMKILIVEDMEMFREALVRVCSRDFGHQVVGATGNGGEALTMIHQYQPDVLLLDLRIDGIDGFALIAAVRSEKRRPKIIVVSAYCDDFTLLKLNQLTVDGIVDKNATALNAIGDALSVVSSGRRYISKAVQDADKARRQNARFDKILSEWECTILTYVGQGLDDDEIACRLNIASRTVQGHRIRIAQKLGIETVQKLMAFSIAHGFTSVLKG